MNLKTKKIKSNISDKLGLLSQKTDYKKPSIIKISNNIKVNHKKSSIFDQLNQIEISKIEHLKNNGIMYTNFMKFR